MSTFMIKFQAVLSKRHEKFGAFECKLSLELCFEATVDICSILPYFESAIYFIIFIVDQREVNWFPKYKSFFCLT